MSGPPAADGPRTVPRIALITDFGTRDPYVAAMKGVIASICPEASILDLTHEIPPQSVLEGAYFLAGAVPWFPAGTLHVAVVDPGVGTARRPVAASVAGQTVVCPDNGLLTLLAREHGLDEVRAIENPDYFLETVSATFHGRDVFAPAAAHLAAGKPFEGIGPVVTDPVRLPLSEPRVDEYGTLRGEVVHIDRFGNAVTNLPRRMVESADPIRVELPGGKTVPLLRTYGEAAAGSALALFGSGGYLEIAINGGSAASEMGIGPGAEIRVFGSTDND